LLINFTNRSTDCLTIRSLLQLRGNQSIVYYLQSREFPKPIMYIYASLINNRQGKYQAYLPHLTASLLLIDALLDDEPVSVVITIHCTISLKLTNIIIVSISNACLLKSQVQFVVYLCTD